jgi:hypothetical protein
MKTYLLLLVLITPQLLAVSTNGKTDNLKADPTPKDWPDKFKSSFTEKIYFPILGTRTTQGTWYYSFGTKNFRVDRDDGSRDRYCGLIFPL